MLTRRQMLASAAALPLVCGPSPMRAASSETFHVIRAASETAQIAPPDYPETEIWAYNAQVPGETLRYRQGDMLQVRLDNALEEATTIHWHGLRLPNAMDGVPGVTQMPVASGATFDYRFALRDAGTFWYHPHLNALEQISRGLAGVLVVQEPDAPDVDRDEVIVLDDWRMTDEAQIHPSFDNRHDMSHAGRLGNYITANARPELRFDVPTGTRLRLRLVNTTTARIFALNAKGLRGWIMALDGMPLAAPAPFDSLDLAPAQRADLMVDITDEAEAFIASTERDGTFALVTFNISGPGSALRPAPAALPPNDLPRIALANARRLPLLMEGGAMRGLPNGADWKGSKLDFRGLAELGQFWAFNGVAGMPDTPFVLASLGEVIRIPITNRTAFAHAMHLHGMHFREVAADETLGPWRDTLLVSPDQTRVIAFVAENPGDWMFHCHMAAHQMAGMMNWIKVV